MPNDSRSFPIDTAGRRAIAEALLGEFDEHGFCRCPGADLHTHQKQVRGRVGRDCRVYLDRVPTIKCMHSSCADAVAEANRKLRSEIGKHEVRKAKEDGYVLEAPKRRRSRTPEEREKAEAEKRAVALARRTEAALPAILERHAWTRADWWEASQDWMGEMDGMRQARALLSLFKPDDIVWCGLHGDSISSEDAARTDRFWRKRREEIDGKRPFRMAREWIAGIDERGELPGPRIVPSSFKPGRLDRSNEAVMQRRFLVIENDSPEMTEIGRQCALLRWLQAGCGLNLRAVIFTGGKSLHGWFDAPMPNRLAELQVMLCGAQVTGFSGRVETVGGLGFDKATFVPSQAYRVPGWKHDKTGKDVDLWYLGGHGE